jgi:uncharacterized membrane protein YphA (DoxX/SURF4 family)
MIGLVIAGLLPELKKLGLVAAVVFAGFVALKTWGYSQQSVGAVSERDRAIRAGAANVAKAEKARAAVRAAESKRVGVRDPAQRD